MAKEDDKKYVRAYSNYILGIISVVTAVITSWGIGGVVFGIIGLTRVKKDKGEIAKKAKTLNLIGLILGGVLFIVSAVYSIYRLKQGIY